MNKDRCYYIIEYANHPVPGPCRWQSDYPRRQYNCTTIRQAKEFILKQQAAGATIFGLSKVHNLEIPKNE